MHMNCRKVECLKFNDLLCGKYFFKRLAIYVVICNGKVSILKEYNLRQHYFKTCAAYDQFVGSERLLKAENIVKSLILQHKITVFRAGPSEVATHAGYEIFKLIVKN